MILTTPFYETIEDNDVNHPEHLANYQPYDLFALRTKITGYIANKLGIKNLGIRFGTEYIKSRIQVTVVPLDIDRINDLDLNSFESNYEVDLSNFSKDVISDIQARINFEVSQRPDYALALATNNYELSYNGERIPESWTMHMIPSLNISDRNYGTYEIEGGSGYLYLNLRTADHLEDADKREDEREEDINTYDFLYSNILASIEEQLLEFYKQSRVIGADLIASQWALERMDSDLTKLGIYKPKWEPLKYIGNRIEFIQELIRDPQTVCLHIPDGENQVTRYLIAKCLFSRGLSYRFENCKVYIGSVEGYAHLKDLIDEVDHSLSLCNSGGESNGIPTKVVYLINKSYEIALYYRDLMIEKLPYFPDQPPLIYIDSEMKSYITIARISYLQDPECVLAELRK